MHDDKTPGVHETVCPITLEAFRDPVLASDGHVYERRAITHWIGLHGTSPLTRQILTIEDLRPDQRLKRPTFPQNSLIASPNNRSFIRSNRLDEWKKRSFVIWFLVFITVVGTLGITLLLVITTKYGSNKNINPPPGSISNSCLRSSRVTTLVEQVNTTRFNYTYYSYRYSALTFNDTIVFSFLADSSYWCLDDLTMKNMYSGAQLIRNSGFESGLLQPFSFCSTNNYSMSSILRANSTQRSGLYAFCAGSVSSSGYLFQNLNTTKGQTYNMSFWMRKGGGSNNRFNVLIVS